MQVDIEIGYFKRFLAIHPCLPAGRIFRTFGLLASVLHHSHSVAHHKKNGSHM